MSWQDWVLGVGGFIFSVALIPSIISKDKPSAKTSLMTASILTVYLLVYISLNLWLACLSGALSAACWWILFFQKIIINEIVNTIGEK